VKVFPPIKVDDSDVTGTGEPEVALIAVCSIVERALDDALIAKRRMTIVASVVLVLLAYAAILAPSGVVVAVNPSGMAKATLLSANETFGGGHARKLHEFGKVPTDVPSGHWNESTGQATVCDAVGFSSAFL
jgi:hypothetical protein